MSTQDIGFDAQTPSLPQGGGAVSGLGATYEPELCTGSGSYVIPLDVPNGPNSIGPRLTLRYDTGSGNGPFGLGFSLPLPRILLDTAHGYPRYDGGDPLLLEGAGPILDLGADPVSGQHRYRLEVDAAVWQVEASGAGFRLTDRDGRWYFLGTSPAARLSGRPPGMPGGAECVFAWHLERIEDPLGYTATFTWARDEDGRQLYLERVAYGPYEVRLHYSMDRPDPVRSGRAGFLVTTSRLCQSIELCLPGEAHPVLRRWELAYKPDPLPANNVSLLTDVALIGIAADGAELPGPALHLRYSSPAPRTLRHLEGLPQAGAPGPFRRDDNRAELVDWTGDGLPDLLEIGPGGEARLWPNLGDCQWGAPHRLGNLPGLEQGAVFSFADLNGDGCADLYRSDRRLDGYLPRAPGGGFERPVLWPQAPDVPPDDCHARLVDLDGDGIPDLMADSRDALLLYYRQSPVTASGQTGSDGRDGWQAAPRVVPRGQAPVPDLSDPHVMLADMTGDGTCDLVRADGGGVTYWPYLGLGRWAPPVIMAGAPHLPRDTDPQRLFLSDIDGDGCADLLYLGLDYVRYWINQSGVRFSQMHEIRFLPPIDPAETRLADMTGVGAPGLLWNAPRGPGRAPTYYFLDLNGGVKPYLLSSVADGIGTETRITYTTSAREAAHDRRNGRPWSTFLPIVVSVVAEVTIRDQATGVTSCTRYRYHDGRYDGVLREFAGFGCVEQDQLGDATIPTLRTVTWFYTGVDPDHPSERMPMGERRRRRSVRGHLRRRERYGLDGSPDEGRPYDRQEDEWIADSQDTAGGRVYLPRLRRSIQTTLERQPQPAAQVVVENLAWDADGNLTDSVRTERTLVGPYLPPGSVEEHQRIIHADYVADANRRFISRPSRITERDGNGQPISDTVLEYDGLPEGVGQQGLVTRRLALALTDEVVTAVYGADPPDLAVLGYFRRPGENGWWIQQAAYQRLEIGGELLGRITNPLGAVTEFAYEPHGMFATRVTDPAGNTLHAQYDLRACRLARLVEANGVEHQAVYDALARLTRLVYAGDTPKLPTATYEYLISDTPVERVTRNRAVSGGSATVDSRERFDSSGHLLERRVSGDDGEVIVECHAYNARGQRVATFVERIPDSSTFALPAPDLAHLSICYDALGRPVRQERPDGGVYTWRYAPLLVELADEEDNTPGSPHFATPVRRWQDASGRLRAVQENVGGAWFTSLTEYDPDGRISRHTDAAGHTVRFWYDLLGRPLCAERPESTTVAVFDAAGNPVEGRAADGSRVLRTYDPCLRPIAIRYNDPNAIPVVRFTYHDNGVAPPPEAGAHSAGGRCVRIDDESGATILDYDLRGRVALKRALPLGTSQAYDLRLEYRPDGQLARVVYPDGQIAEYIYDRRGQLASIPGVIEAVEYDLAGRKQRMRYANGIEQCWDYDSVTRRLTSMAINDPGGQPLWSTAYTWDLVGNLVCVDSPDPCLAAQYTYDDLYRLVNASTGAGECWGYTYDAAGNLTFKSDVGAYQYGGDGAPANCLTNAGSWRLSYDARGQMRDTPWGRMDWDSVGRLVRIHAPGGGQTEFRYDYAGRRAAVQNSSGTPGSQRLTPDPLYAVEDGRLVLHISDGRCIVARRSGQDTCFLHVDHLGSTVLISEASGAVSRRVRYDPWGQVLAKTGSDPLTVGYIGADLDSGSGLLYLTSRYYHPVLGRFISPDSLVGEAGRLGDWNLYAYCNNNPLIYADPSGHGWLEWLLGGIAIVASVFVPGTTAVVVGAVSGATAGGIAAYERGGDVWNILGGMLFGAAVGGLCAYANIQLGDVFKIGQSIGAGQKFFMSVGNGALSMGIRGTGTGIVTGFAGGMGKGGDIFEHMMTGMALGMMTGAILGAASLEPPQSKNLRDVSLGQFKEFAPPESFRDPAEDIRWFGALTKLANPVGTLMTKTINALSEWGVSQVASQVVTSVGQMVATDMVITAYNTDAGRSLIDKYLPDLYLVTVGIPGLSYALADALFTPPTSGRS